MRSPEYFDDCDDCHGPVKIKTRWELVRDWLAYDLFMALPWSIAKGPIGFWLLTYAGGYAYTCTCPAKVLRRAQPHDGADNA